MAPLAAIVFDSLHPARLARFWASALTDYDVRDYTNAEIEELKQSGLTPETDPSVAVDGGYPILVRQVLTNWTGGATLCELPRHWLEVSGSQ